MEVTKLQSTIAQVNQSESTSTSQRNFTHLISSRLAFIFVAAGAAIGLGNIWKFPYMVGMHGGSAFVLSYLVCVLIVGVPTMIAEILIGRASRQEPVTAFKQLAKSSNSTKLWGLAGGLGILTSVIALSFYSVVAGWAIGYAGFAVSAGFEGTTASKTHTLWGDFLSNPVPLIVYHSLFMAATVAVNAFGVNQGIERMSKIVLPMLLIILIGLAVVAFKHGDMVGTLKFMFAFRTEELSSEAILSAMGHAFFTLAVGACAMLAYGAYMPKSSCIMRSVFIISTIDVIVALLAGLAIFPIVFAYELTPEAGPGLMFQVLPVAFGQMQYGAVVGFFFFVLLLFSAWTTSIAMVEPILTFASKKFKMTRAKTAVSIGLFAWTLGLVSVFSFSALSDVQLWRWGLFDLLTDLTSNILLPLGGLSVAVFVGWGLSQSIIKEQLPSVSSMWFRSWFWILKYLTPIGIILIMLHALFF